MVNHVVHDWRSLPVLEIDFSELFERNVLLLLLFEYVLNIGPIFRLSYVLPICLALERPLLELANI